MKPANENQNLINFHSQKPLLSSAVLTWNVISIRIPITEPKLEAQNAESDCGEARKDADVEE